MDGGQENIASQWRQEAWLSGENDGSEKTKQVKALQNYFDVTISVLYACEN